MLSVDMFNIQTPHVLLTCYGARLIQVLPRVPNSHGVETTPIRVKPAKSLLPASGFWWTARNQNSGSCWSPALMPVVSESHVGLECFVHILCWDDHIYIVTFTPHIFVALLLIFVCYLIFMLPLQLLGLVIKICPCEFGHLVIWQMLLNIHLEVPSAVSSAADDSDFFFSYDP